MKLLSGTAVWYCLLIMLYKVVLSFKSVDETRVCDHSNESYCAVLSGGVVSCHVIRDVFSTLISLFENMVKHGLSCLIHYLPAWIKFNPQDNRHIDEILLLSEPHGCGPKSL